MSAERLRPVMAPAARAERTERAVTELICTGRGSCLFQSCSGDVNGSRLLCSHHGGCQHTHTHTKVTVALHAGFNSLI